MSRILLSNNTLSQYAGSELVTFEIAQHLASQEHQITVATFARGGEIREDFERLGIEWLDLSKPLPSSAIEFDLLWGHHFTCFDALLLNPKVRIPRAIHSSLSPYMGLECPPLYADEMTLRLANSQETRQVLEDFGIEGDSIIVMPNCVTQEWVDHTRQMRGRSLKSIAVVSHHAPPEIKALVQLLKNQGISVTIFGGGPKHQRVTPELLSGFDAVVTIGRTTQAALALSLPVYCYDHFGGPGYLTQDNFEQAALFNFSGRCCNRKIDDQTIATELITHFEQAKVQAAILSERIRSDFFLPTWVDRVLNAAFAQPALPSPPTGKIAQALRIHSAANQDTKRAGATDSATTGWLAARQPTRTQRAIVSRHLSGIETPCIGIVIHDPTGNQKAIASTLESLRPSNLSYRNFQVHIVSPLERAGSMLNDHSPAPTWQRASAETAINAINRAAAETRTDWILLIEAGEQFTKSGLQAIALGLSNATDVRAVYADEMMQTLTGSVSALLRPDFNLDLLLSMPSSMARHWLVRRDVFLEAGGFDQNCPEAPELDLLLRLIDSGGIEGLGHVHEPLLVVPPQLLRSTQTEQDAILRHIQNRGYAEATVDTHAPGCYRINYQHGQAPGVSIVIPTRNQFGLLQRCLDTLLEKTTYKNYEVLIVDNDSSAEDACTWLSGIEAMQSPQLRVLRHPGAFNYASIINTAAQQARGEYLLLLDNDTATLREDWLDALINHAQRPEVGVVGAKLLHPDGTVQHAGSVLGLRGPANSGFSGEKFDAPGYMHRLQVDQDYSAVSGSCLMIRKSVFDAVGGMDSGALRNSFSDTDLCLKVRQAGYLVVWTPHALVLHEGGASQLREDKADVETRARRLVEAQDAAYEKWLPQLADDPAYNRNMTLNGAAFQIETDARLNWNPLPWRPLPVALAIPADRHGCGHYRILQPVSAMQEFGLADARIADRYPTPVELERLSPDVLVLQRQMSTDQLIPLKQMSRLNRSFKVAELDDYLPNVPLKSVHKGQLPSDVLKMMRDALKLADRFVVSTAPLAEALKGLHPDIRVVENHLPLPWWGGLRSKRRQSTRPRVGWGGGAGHRGDLELIADVIRTLADEVEWVFLGMCPDKIRPFIHEFHPGVKIEAYPAQLASLDLDLALAPLEDNLFNRCKSNLRLLEYGACGFPVICSDIAPYQGDLPVTRVKPRFKDWVDAIRMHTHDLDAAAAAGDALRNAVHRDWMLDEKHAAFWLSQWLPD